MNGKVSEMEELVAQLNAAADAYYNGRGELMTDFEWDALFDKVKDLEAETGIVLPNSPTNRVSADNMVGRKEAHAYPALSLAKTKSVAEVAKWAENRPIWLSWKLDGLTLVVTWENGCLAKIVTRGDGHVGTNITHLASGISGIPRTVAVKGTLVVRGEAVISYADFEAFRATSGDDFANPRNLASGSLSLKNPEELKLRHLTWIPFTLVAIDTEINSWGERMNLLVSLGLTPVAHELISQPTVEKLEQTINQWTEQVTKKFCPYPVDGLVVVYDDILYATTGSVTGHHATRAGFAFKWQDKTATATLESIDWSCATGRISPVAVFSPVTLEGTVVKRALLCNISECERLGMGGAGTILSVIKANKIIPKVVAVTERKGSFEIPTTCPVCGAKTEIRISESGTKTLHCIGASCPARSLAKYVRFVSKAGMEIDGLAAETLTKFVNCGWIRTMADILRLGDHRDEIAQMDGFGERSADNICAAVAAAKTCPLDRFLVALSIPNCGADVAKKLAATYDTEVLFAAAASGDRAVFANLDGIGPVKSAAVVDWYSDPAHQALIADLLTLVQVTVSRKSAVGNKCAGLVFVVTGEVHHYPNRDALKEYVESQGGKVVGSVSSKTSFLINNDVSSTSGKNRKARELNVPVLSEDDFIARFG